MSAQLEAHYSNPTKGYNALVEISGFKTKKGFSKDYAAFFPVEFIGVPIVEAMFTGHNNHSQALVNASKAAYFKLYAEEDDESSDKAEIRKLMKAHLAKKGNNLVKITMIYKKQNDEQKDEMITFNLDKAKLTRSGEIIMISADQLSDGELKIGSDVHPLEYERQENL